VKTEESATVSARVSSGVHETLRLHAQRCGRSIGREVRLWSEFGCAATCYARLFEPDILPAEETEALRASALDDMASTLAVLLPHTVQAAAPIGQMLPTN
jgi:hypothetical protein